MTLLAQLNSVHSETAGGYMDDESKDSWSDRIHLSFMAHSG
ncbi:MAG: hypothetical protein ACR5LD_04325 [Symbiopectobacterium sp.]